MDKYKQLEQRLTSNGTVGDTFIIDTVLLSNKFHKVKSKSTDLAMFKIGEMQEYSNKYKLPMKDVKYNINVVSAVESGIMLELPAYEQGLYVEGYLK